MKVPIANLLRRRSQLEIAAFQDTVVDILYRADKEIVLHGGTAVWRCYDGNRFSDDIDAYISPKSDIDNLKAEILLAASAAGIGVRKIKDTGNLLFIALSMGRAYMKVEINHRKGHLHPISRGYERVDGTRTEVLTLSTDDLIAEKIAAYKDRRFIRDIYDIYLLCNYADEKKIGKAALGFLKDIRPPINESELDGLVYLGVTPTFKSMVEAIRARFS